MSDKKRRRKSSHHGATTGKFHLLSGQLTARSHILNTSPEVAIFEVCTATASEYILCRETNFVLLNHPLTIGQHYKFSNLHLTALKIKSETVRCFRVTDETSWQEYESPLTIYHPPFYIDFTNIQGKITKVDLDFGILYLQSIPVIISSCSLVAKIPMPKENQRVHIFNVHSIEGENGQTVYAMCVKSYIRILGEGSEISILSPLYVNKSPIFLSLGSNASRSSKFMLWLQNCSGQVKKRFCEDFLLSYGVSRSDFSKFYTTLVKNIALYILNKSKVKKQSLLEEFFAPDHNGHCGILTEETVPCSLLNLFEIDQETPHLDEDEDTNGMKLFWQFDVKQDLERLFMGVISVKSVSHRLTINDSTGSLYCLMLPEQGQGMTQSDVAFFNRKVVLFTDYNVIRERFTWTEGDQLFSQKYKCFGALADKVTVVASLPPFNTDHIDKSKEKYCISPWKEANLTKFLSQHITVQHKTMPFVPEQGKPARSYLLVLVHGEMTLNTSSRISSQKNSSVPMFIALKGPLLGAHPLISVNTVYELRFPIGFDVDFFKKPSQLYQLLSLRAILPTVNSVILPSCCEIFTVPDNPIPSTVMKYRDCYGITDCLENVSTREFINVVGYVVGRYHQEPLFEREKQSVKANGFGIPGSKVVAIILRDTPPDSQIGSPITLYLSYWATLQYPICLVPGSRVIFRFVIRVCGKEGSVYLRSSILSSMEVLELPNTEKSDENYKNRDVWGPRSSLDLILQEGSKCCQWLTVSMTQLHRASFEATCSICSHVFRNGCCSFVGCCSVSKAPRVFAQISFLIEDFSSLSALVFVPDSLIRKLFVGSEESLRKISQMTERYGQLHYYRYQSSEDISQLPVEQKVFRVMCKSFLTRSRFHLLCRQFNKSKNVNYQSGLKVLFAVDINPVSLLMGTS